jgi:nucleotide-binding universal stress UspA family protein
MRNLVIAIDFSDVTPYLIKEAARLAGCCKARVYVIHVAAPDPDFVGYTVGPVQERQFRADRLHTEKKELEQLAAELRSRRIDAVPLLIQGETAKLLLKELVSLQASMLIMGTHGKGLVKTALLGSISHEIVQNTTCPVLLVPYKKSR